MSKRLIATGQIPGHHHLTTLIVRYAIDDKAWSPRLADEVDEFDPDARNKEQEEAYGPDDVR